MGQMIKTAAHHVFFFGASRIGKLKKDFISPWLALLYRKNLTVKRTQVPTTYDRRDSPPLSKRDGVSRAVNHAVVRKLSINSTVIQQETEGRSEMSVKSHVIVLYKSPMGRTRNRSQKKGNAIAPSWPLF